MYASHLMLVTTAAVIFESKLGYRPNFAKMHPKERDFWYARAQQSYQSDGCHQWASRRAFEMLAGDLRTPADIAMDEAEARIVSAAMRC